MLALLAVYLVVVLGLALAWRHNYFTLHIPRFRSTWLMFIAFSLTVFSYFFYLPPLLKFVSTQAVLLTLLLINRNIPGFKLLILGMLANAIPTLANGYGLMPVAAELMPQLCDNCKWEVYKKIGWSVVLPADEIAFFWLSDWIFVPVVGKAYSPGDILTLAGALWFLVRMAKLPDKTNEKQAQPKTKVKRETM